MSRTLVSVMALSALLAACSSVPKKTDASSATAAQQSAQRAESEAVKLQRVVNTLAEKSVYFDYDKFTIKPEYETLLQQDSAALKTVPQASIRLEGNADERGSAEYNLALGQKRAEAVKRALQLLGVPETQLEAVSFGKEKPRATCSEEKCWAENRRVDFAYKKPESH